MSNSINFPAEHYIGMIMRKGDDLPLGFLTPEGSDKAAEKRKETVDGWVGWNSRGNDKQGVKPTVRKNEPMSGFRVLHSVRRDSSWGSGNVKWRIEDPRGFELEISSPNMMQIMACTVLDQSEILDACMWAREGKENILVPVSSEVYRQAVENTARLGRTASLKDLKIGYRCVLKNGTKARFMGKMFKLDYEYDRSYSGDYREYLISSVKYKPVWVFIEEDEDGSVLEVNSSPKLADIIPDTEMTPKESEAFLKAHRAREMKKTYWRRGYSDYTFSKSPITVSRGLIETEWNCKHTIAFQHPDTQEWVCCTQWDLDDRHIKNNGGVMYAKANASLLEQGIIREQYRSRDMWGTFHRPTNTPKLAVTILEYLKVFRAVTYVKSEDGSIDLTVSH